MQAAPPPVEPPKEAPTKSSADIQKDSERERKRLAFSSQGLSALITTNSFGDFKMPEIAGVSINGMR